MKDVMSKKRRLEDYETVKLTEECSDILQRKLPQKLKDPGSFTIPCTIGSFTFEKAFCDLGANISLMPLSVFKKLGLSEVKRTTITLQMADRSLTYPKGTIEDVLVKVDKFIFPVDFVVLDMEEDREIPIILGRPFLTTGKALIDVHSGKLTLWVNDEEVQFNLYHTLKFPNEVHSCNRLDVLDYCVRNAIHDVLSYDPLEHCLMNSHFRKGTLRTTEFGESCFGINEDHVNCMLEFDILPMEAKSNSHGGVSIQICAIEKPKKESELANSTTNELVLKQLPNHLRYAFLGEDSKFSVIISSSLSQEEEDKLLGVLRGRKSALGWSIYDINGISPTICMHKILTEKTFKPSIEHQRRLNPAMKEVVRVEVLKLLNAGII
ncbi:Aspartic peptidase domain containing protein [Trema orientale]|uniref:Aspartic peptidase domain containing protein n=1 Tax=Trema orientale TaxID=63057 RepID=A0A2P5B7A0_TREOI|nr:Aspartic peptidase domain containing protein [Trema orientale]